MKNDKFQLVGYRKKGIAEITTGEMDDLVRQYNYELDNYLMRKNMYVFTMA